MYRDASGRLIGPAADCGECAKPAITRDDAGEPLHPPCGEMRVERRLERTPTRAWTSADDDAM